MFKWRYIESKASSARWNMAVDEALLRTFKEGDLPIFRLYEWEEPSLSIGRFSDPLEVLHWESVEKAGMAYVRRMTGGGILVHGDDLSYTLIVPESFAKENGVRESYRYLCGFLLAFYRKIGVDADFAGEQGCRLAHTEVCLAGKERYDIVIDGRKIGGNAQRHTHEAMLQHGSVPKKIERRYFEPFFRKETGFDQAVTLEQLGIAMDSEHVRQVLKASFCETFNTSLVPEELSEAEEALARRLYEEKYNTEVWNVHAKNSVH